MRLPPKSFSKRAMGPIDRLKTKRNNKIAPLVRRFRRAKAGVAPLTSSEKAEFVCPHHPK